MEENFINPGLILSRNGDTAVQLIQSGKIDNIHSGLKDLSTVNEMFDFNQDRLHLGMLYTFDSMGSRMNRQNFIPSFITRMLQNNAVITVDGGNPSFTYSTPVVRYWSLRIMKSTEASECSEKPGLGGSMFPIYLNKALRQGDLITYDLEDGIQLHVTEDMDIVPVGDMFKHYVKISNGDGTLWFPLDKLTAGTEYFKLGHTMGEFSEEYSEFLYEWEEEELLQEFTLANHMGVSVKTTLYAGERAQRGFTTATKSAVDRIVADVNLFQTSTNRPYDALILMNNYINSTVTGDNITYNANNATVMSLFEAMAVAELTRMEVTNMIWAKEAFITEINGQKRVNEGVYQQFRRGHVFTYAVPGSVDVPFLQRISSQIFRYSENIPVHERRIHMIVGGGLAENLDWLINNLGLSKLNQPELRGLYGNSALIQQPIVTGTDLMNLSISDIRFTDVYIPGVGHLTYEHDPSLDFAAGQSRANNKTTFYGGRSRGTYSGYIDLRDARSTNVFDDPNIIRGGSFPNNRGDNPQPFPTSVFYVRPERSLHWGWENGRMNSVGNMLQQLSHHSSVKAMTQEFWMHTRSAAWVGDKSSIFLIELERPCMTII